MTNITDLTHEQLAGQRIIMGFDGTQLDERLKYLIGTLKVGGLILFSKNIETPEQVGKLCAACKAYAKSCGQPPLFMAVDQEGGEVARLKQPFTLFSGNPQMRDLSDAANFASITARELSSIHINMNMAPVMDVAFDKETSIMKGRAFGSDPRRVAEMGTKVIQDLQRGGIMAVAKHFPGIGRTILDSHNELPKLSVTREQLAASDIIPFRAAIDAGVAAIMLSHIHYDQIDNLRPASFSTVIAKDLLREEMGYNGVVMTDDLDMGAIAPNFTIEDVLENLLHAEIDVALICHESDKLQKTFDYFLKKINASGSQKSAFLRSVGRIMKLKSEYMGIDFRLSREA